MTVSTPDPVVPAKVGRNEPIDLDLTTDPAKAVVTIYWADGTWDCAYQEGTFHARKFPGSFVEGSRITINPPSGGWPQLFEPRVTEATEAVASGSAWGELYQIDLTAQPTLAMGGPGSYTIDGKTWWVKGALALNEEIGLFNGSGLKHGNGNNGDSDLLLPTDGSAPAFSIYAMPLAQLTGFNSDAPTAIQFRATVNTLGSVSPPTANGVGFYAGLVDADLNSAAWSTRTTQMISGQYTRQQQCTIGGSSTLNAVSDGDNVVTPANRVFTLVRAGKQMGVAGKSVWSGSYPSVDAGADVAVSLGLNASAWGTSPCLFYACRTVATQSATSYLMSLRILQPVPA